jgi:hypothetical protein
MGVLALLFSVVLILLLPKAAAVNPGDYIVTQHSSGTLDDVTTGGVKTVILSGLNMPEGVAVDSSGNYIVAERGAGRLDKITTGGVKTVILSGLPTDDLVWVAVTPTLPIPEYPLSLPLLVIFMVVAYGLIRRKTSANTRLVN